MKDFACIGEVVLDTFIHTNYSKILNEKRTENEYICFSYGAKVDINSIQEHLGGSAHNVSFSLSKFGYSTELVSKLPRNIWGKDIMYRLNEEKINTKKIILDKKAQLKRSFILRGKGGERTILVFHGKHSFKNDDLNMEQLSEYNWIYIAPLPDQTYPIYQKILQKGRKFKVACNLGSNQIREDKIELKKILSKIDILIQNQEEAEEIIGKLELTKLCKKIQSTGPKIIVITRGPKGAVAFDGITYFQVPAFPGKAEEVTGAGDAFSAGFLAGYYQRKNIEAALKWGSINAASVIEKVGATEGLLTKYEIEKRIKDTPEFEVEMS